MKRCPTILFLLVTLGFYSCSMNSQLQRRYQKLENFLHQDRPLYALKQLENSKKEYSDNDKVLYLLDRGILSYYADKYTDALHDFQIAERLIEQNYTKSVSKALLSVITNDYALDYFGEDYETIYINIFKALTYIRLDDNEAAFVEIKRINEKFKALSTRFAGQIDKLEAEGIHNKRGRKIIAGDYPFTDSALSRYISAILYRGDDRPDDAEIDKQKIKNLWRTHSFLYKNSSNKINSLRTELINDSAILNIVAFCDGGPFKYAWTLEAVTLGNYVKISSSDPYFEYIFQYESRKNVNFKFSIPRIAERRRKIDRVNVYVNGKIHRTLHEMENFGRTAVNNFNYNNSLVIIKSFLRTLGKAFLMSKTVTYFNKKEKRDKKKAKNVRKQKNNISTSLLLAILGSALNSTEQADLRTWRLIPGRAEVGEFVLPYGDYLIQLDFIGKNGNVIKSVTERKILKKNKKVNMVIAYAY